MTPDICVGVQGGVLDSRPLGFVQAQRIGGGFIAHGCVSCCRELNTNLHIDIFTEKARAFLARNGKGEG